MKILLINGSPHLKGCTYTALDEVRKTLVAAGVEGEIYHIGAEAISGCKGCGYCKKEGKGVCIIKDDKVNEFIALAKDFDGYIFGAPVHFASPCGSIVSFMDRVFYAGKEVLSQKPAAAVVSCRRGGASASFDVLNKYFMLNSMPVVSSQYWNSVHGNTAQEVARDEEGLQTMRTLAGNMVYLVRCIEAGKQQGITPPELPKIIRTNFIR